MVPRQTAYKIRIKDLFSGTYVIEEGEWAPNYILFKDKKISRVNVIANIIDKYENEDKSYGAIDLDDGTAVIKGKVWKEDVQLLENINIGDPVLVIGKVKEFNNERYLMPEIIKVLDNTAWAELRKIELEKIYGKEPQEVEIKEPTISSRQKVLSFIEKSEEVNEEELLNKIELDKEEVLKVINELIKEGEIYRPTPGCLRIV